MVKSTKDKNKYAQKFFTKIVAGFERNALLRVLSLGPFALYTMIILEKRKEKMS
jgi:hypothetical protein